MVSAEGNSNNVLGTDLVVADFHRSTFRDVNNIGRSGFISTLGALVLGTVGYIGSFVDQVKPVNVQGYPNMAVVSHYLMPDDIMIDSDNDGSFDMRTQKYLNINFPGETQKRMRDITSRIYSSE
jgi:hypothetical protein